MVAANPISPPGPRQYRAAPFNSPDEDEKAVGPLIGLPEPREFQRYIRQTEINWLGCIVFSLYLCSFVFYLWIRISKTLNLGPYLAYGWYPPPPSIRPACKCCITLSSFHTLIMCLEVRTSQKT